MGGREQRGKLCHLGPNNSQKLQHVFPTGNFFSLKKPPLSHSHDLVKKPVIYIVKNQMSQICVQAIFMMVLRFAGFSSLKLMKYLSNFGPAFPNAMVAVAAGNSQA